MAEHGLELHSEGAALLLDHNTLVVADLHLGCEAALEYEGLSLPRMQTHRLRQLLTDMVRQLRPEALVVAGDLKHNFSRNLVQEWNDVVDFMRSISALTEVSVVRGNHDNYLNAILSELQIPLRKEIRIGRHRIMHGHSGMAQGPTVMGHLHPCMALSDDVGGRIKQPCFLHDRRSSTLVLPAMSIVSPGVDVARRSVLDTFSPVLGHLELGSFSPIIFVDGQPLVFPTLKEIWAGARQD